MDWSAAGAGTIPARPTACATIAAYTGTAAAINNALNSCASGQHVKLGAGTFNLSTALDIEDASVNNVTLRGSGADSTFIKISTASGCNGLTSLACFGGANNDPGGVNQKCDWTSGLSQGSTTITLNCTPTNLNIGSVVFLDQVDTADPGTIFNCGSSNCAAEGAWGRTDAVCVNSICNRAQFQAVTVTNCTNTAGTCTSGTNITISPGIYLANWTSVQKPEGWWGNSYLHDFGVEDLSIEPVGNPGIFNIQFFSCYKCWAKGVRSLTGDRAHIKILESSNVTIRDSYFYQNHDHLSQSYCVENEYTGNNLEENNIFQQCTDSTPSNTGGFTGSVVSYNFAINTAYGGQAWMQQSYYLHDGGDFMNLWEGNIGVGFTSDVVHGNHHLETLFRNNLWGWQKTCGGTTCASHMGPTVIQAGSRYFNIVGNVLGTPGFHTNYDCQALSTASCGPGMSVTIFTLGYTGNGDSNSSLNGFCINAACVSKVAYDSLTPGYMMRWGNWDNVTNTVRWCGNSSDTGWSTTCASTSEVPTALASLANPVPATETLPASFVYNSKPTWWGSRAWPGVGPDVSSGNVGQCSGGTYDLYATDVTGKCTGGSKVIAFGGHVAMSPSMDCFLNTMSGPVDGSGSALTFNASTCYPLSSGVSSVVGPGAKLSGNGALVH